MREIIVLTVISALTFLFFLAIIILGLTRKSKKLKVIAFSLFFIFISTAAWTGFKFVVKTYNKVSEIIKPRTGDEIYNALFGKTQINCVRILKYQDQVIPRIDYAIWLYFETCPRELRRILSLHDFSSKTLSTNGWDTDGPLANENWFKPETLGDSIIVFTCIKDEDGNGQYIYSSLDSTKVFCKDIFD